MTEATQCDTDASIYDIVCQPLRFLLLIGHQTIKRVKGRYIFVPDLFNPFSSKRVNTVYTHIRRTTRWDSHGIMTSRPEAALISSFLIRHDEDVSDMDSPDPKMQQFVPRLRLL